MRYVWILILLCGCTASKASVAVVNGVVLFDYPKGEQIKMSYKDKDKEAAIDTKSPSTLRTLLEGAVVQGMNKDIK